jgi:hypothetical protein
MENSIKKELLNMHESMLRAQLNVIKQLRKEAGLSNNEDFQRKGMSQMDMVYDILLKHSQPMHVNLIIEKIKNKFDVQLDKETVVSALAKRVKRQDRFMKIAPNTFALISQNH